MIINGVLLVAQAIINILLSPLTLINIAIDFVASIPIVTEFLQIVAYLLPWSNILPLIHLVVGIFVFRGVLALIKLIWHFIPVIRKLGVVYI